MDEISFGLLGPTEEENTWDFTTKSFAREVFEDLGPYAGVLSEAELRVLAPANPREAEEEHLTPEQFQQMMDHLAAIHARHMLPPPDPVLHAERIREANERAAQKRAYYEAMRPWVRQPAELLAALQKLEHHLRQTKTDWYEYQGHFRYDVHFEDIYTLLHEAIRLGRPVRWEWF